MPRRLGVLLWPAGVTVGLAAERVQFGWNDPQHWIPDLVVGWTLIACGLVGAARRPESRIGLLMTAAGFSWFLGNFAAVGAGAVAWLAVHAIYLHRGPLVHLILGFPTGRSSSRLVRTGIAVGYAAAIVTPVWRSEVLTIILAALLVMVSAWQYLRTVGRARRARLAALVSASALSVVLGGYAVARLVAPASDVSGSSILAYEVTLCAIAIGLLAVMLSAWERSAVTDLVVELGEARSDSLRDALARALGDKTLEVGYWVPQEGAFVDSDGDPVSVPDRASGRSVTTVEHDGQPVAVLIHDPAVLDDPGLLEAVVSATQLAASNARLQAEVQARLDELRASRRRLLEAGDEERRRLERRLHEGAERRLGRLAETVREAHEQANGASPATLEKIQRAQGQLDGTLEDLRVLARGLHPRALAELGLDRALAVLADRSPVPVELSIRAQDLPRGVEAAVYFLCSEGLANIAKYAAATRAVISVGVRDGALTVEITDDGVGGAVPSDGTGMLGLADRVETLGGSFRVDSPPGGGTRLIADIPMAGRPS